MSKQLADVESGLKGTEARVGAVESGSKGVKTDAAKAATKLDETTRPRAMGPRP